MKKNYMRCQVEFVFSDREELKELLTKMLIDEYRTFDFNSSL